MESIEQREWMPFSIAKLFDRLEPGKVNNVSILSKSHKGINYIGASNRNNGVLFQLKQTERAQKLIQKGNCIGFIKDGDGSAGYAIYKGEDFISTCNVIYGYANWLNQFTGLFFVASQDKIENKYGHGYKRNQQHLRGDKVMLPTTEAGEPDYEYMEQYVQERRSAMLERYKAYVKRRIAEIGRHIDIPALSDKEWMTFRLGDIGIISSGRDIYASERVDGGTPYITSGSVNNGIGYFVGNANDTLDSGYIALNRNGAVGKAFYHPSVSLMGNDCRKVHLKRANNNLYVGQFVAFCISQQSECFSYSRKLGTARAKVMKILLPVTDSGEPDYEYMEQYAKNMMLRKYQQYLAFLSRQKH